MPRLQALVANGDCAELAPSFPAVTCPVQANMTTGLTPNEHGVVANGFYRREQLEVEMWTSPNECVQRPQLWDIMHSHDASLTAAAWFPLHSKQCGADYVCTPAPIHNADGSESLWCYTRPENLYQELVDELGHFPLQHFWGPAANIKSTAWIVSSAVYAARRHRPNLFYIYLPHLDYAAQKMGPDSEAATLAVGELDAEIGRLADGLTDAYHDACPLWLVASEYTIVPVNHVSYPNRTLRDSSLLAVRPGPDGELRPYDLKHPLTGDLVVVSETNSWQAYYWWRDERQAPAFARHVDIHRKPGYDPVELFWDPAANGVPLDATLVAPATDPCQRGVLVSSQRGVFVERPLADTDVADIVLRQFGI